MHCRIVEELRKHYGLREKPVKIIDPFQMLGEIDEELQEIIGIDTIGVSGPKDMFNNNASEFHEQITPWGQRVMIARPINLTTDKEGDVYIYAEGDTNYPPSAIMPAQCYFINAIERQQPIIEEQLNPSDNLEEYGLLSDKDLAWIKQEVEQAASTGKAVVAGFGGTALGDVAFIPGMGLKIRMGSEVSQNGISPR